jgi:RimJ/RimL family protein N-acetyltransferase
MSPIRLADAYAAQGAVEFLYRLLGERRPEQLIAHRAMPTLEEHRAFFDSRPYRAWYLIEAGEPAQPVGMCTLSNINEVGVFVLRAFHRRGYAREALLELMRRHEPLPAVPALRPGRFVALVNPANEASVALFAHLGFRHTANRYELP